MKKNNEYHRNNENTHMAIVNNGKIISHPTFSENQIFEINQQIDNLMKQLNIVEKRYRYSETGWDKLCLESSITLNISYFHEELSRIYESIGKPLDALNALVTASQSLFEGHCYILNSLMGKGEPHETRLYELDERCKELCSRHPELWDKYRKSNIHYLLEEQHLWPCE